MRRSSSDKAPDKVVIALVNTKHIKVALKYSPTMPMHRNLLNPGGIDSCNLCGYDNLLIVRAPGGRQLRKRHDDTYMKSGIVIPLGLHRE